MTNTRNILTIIALSALGLCLFMALAKMAMKGDKTKKTCDSACGMLVFISAVLLAVAQFMEDSKTESFHEGKPHGSGDKKEVLIPINDQVIDTFDREDNTITVTTPEGLLDIYLSN